MINFIRATNLWGFNEEVRRLGADPSTFLKRFQINPKALENPEAYIVYSKMLRLLETCAIELECPDFGQRLSYAQGLAILGPVAVIARNSETVFDAFVSIGRYLHIHCPALHLNFFDRTKSGHYRFRYEIKELEIFEMEQAYELSLSNGARILELLGGKNAYFQSIGFIHGQLSDASNYRETFHCPINFKEEFCTFEISEELAQKKIENSDRQTWYLAERYLESAHSLNEASMSQQVSELIRLYLPLGQCSINNISAKLALHPRTLQRRLINEQTTYSNLLDRVQRLRAMYYLLETNIHLNHITTLLGYTEQSNLNRACQRWFKMTPRAYRLKGQN